MVLWYAGLALVFVWNIFRDPAMDYRLVVAGALLPDVLDLASGRPAHAHTLAASVLVLAGVMLATRPRRRARRRFLALPIGMFLHLVLEGIWMKQKVLWWPLLGAVFPDGQVFPPLGLALVEELAGAWALRWFVRQFGLTDARRLRSFLRSGRLEGLA